jgi:hypothetical protein
MTALTVKKTDQPATFAFKAKILLIIGTLDVVFGEIDR